MSAFNSRLTLAAVAGLSGMVFNGVGNWNQSAHDRTFLRPHQSERERNRRIRQGTPMHNVGKVRCNGYDGKYHD